ncbi:hypothetical protein P256_00708 [Acinetobacter nectaris CIP 110549]|uniref:Bacteriophage protein n=1 Tax=Acinetobacter nectaris CIP 110549 TaxID=1392540 RepID=V2TQH0_9GAMM|nr:hypothetical protein [Acinetobacter nectaris]ESK40261.1 hypothetical protein P256_00708 [Acinetobacter nectaris CIP 110549]
MGNSFLYRMPSGIPGDVSRKSQSTIEAHHLGAQFASCGLFGIIDANGSFVPPTADTTKPYGILVRDYPFQGQATSLGSSAPTSGTINDVLKRGYMTVLNNAGVAKKGAPVYVRVANDSAAKPLGGIEAIATTNETIAVDAYFMADADANGNVEIAYNI